MKKIILLILLAIIISGCSIKESSIQSSNQSVVQSESNILVKDSTTEDTTPITINSFFLTTKGSYWVYRIVAERLSDNQKSTTIKTNELFKVEVLDNIQRNSELRAVLLTGFPGLTKTTSTLIIKAEKDYYIVDSETAFNSISDNSNDLSSIYDGAHLILSFPLNLNKKFNCDEDSTDRQDNFYCYWVKSIKPSNTKLYPNKSEYQIAFYTNPDSTEYSYVNDVGITYYNYSHNGTLDEERWELVKYFIAK